MLAGAVCEIGARFRLGPVDLALASGSVCVVEGLNGAGKTTLLRAVAGLLSLSAGTRRCEGTALYLRSGAGARDGQTVDDAVDVAAALAGRDRAVARTAVDVVGLARLGDRRVGMLSAGERTRLTLAVALAVEPRVLCLDEPFAHVDAAGGAMVCTVVSRLAAVGCAVMVASPQPRRLCDADGRLLVKDGMVRAT